MKKLPRSWLIVACGVLAAVPGAAAPPGSDDAGGFERMEQRMRAARAMGLVETLALNDTDAARLRDTLRPLDDRREPLMREVHDGMVLLRDAANGSEAAQQRVDETVKRVFDARAKVEALDRELYQAVAKDLPPEKRARAAVFLARFQGRFGMGMGPGGERGGPRGMGPGRRGPGGGGRSQSR